jgi:hypothetical protein
LGHSLTEIFKNAYDNPAAKLFDYAFMPGVPMDFINASMRAPWSFIRNTDDQYAVKVVSEESRFLHWAVDEDRFERSDAFPRLKALGFEGLSELRRFMRYLDHTVQVTDYDLDVIAQLLTHTEPPLAGGPFSIARLKTIARAWMDDVHAFCNVARYVDDLEPERTRFNLEVRQFRRERPWLMRDLRANDCLDYRYPTDGSVLFYGLRRAPEGEESVLFLANMEGAPYSITPLSLPVPDLPQRGWTLALTTPGLGAAQAVRFDQPVTLRDSEGVVFTRAQ